MGRKDEKQEAKAKAQRKLTAKTADRHDLYQRSVQNPVEEVGFVASTYKKLRKRPAVTLREDFCGTAYFSRSWVEAGKGPRSATGIDIDAEVLDWARRHNVETLPEELQERVQLVQRDVRERAAERFDIVTAFNFSYWIFRTRPALREYFETVRAALQDDGVFFLDAYGGWEAHQPVREKRPIQGGFTYVWDQAEVDPIDNGVVNYIHFHFKDGTKLERAFTYEWRLWSLAEIRELLEEAGFRDITIYWDVSEDDTEEDYRPRKRAENQPGWLAYIVATP